MWENVIIFFGQVINPFYELNWLNFAWWFSIGIPLTLILICFLNWDKVKQM